MWCGSVGAASTEDPMPPASCWEDRYLKGDWQRLYSTAEEDQDGWETTELEAGREEVGSHEAAPLVIFFLQKCENQ